MIRSCRYTENPEWHEPGGLRLQYRIAVAGFPTPITGKEITTDFMIGIPIYQLCQWLADFFF